MVEYSLCYCVYILDYSNNIYNCTQAVSPVTVPVPVPASVPATAHTTATVVASANTENSIDKVRQRNKLDLLLIHCLNDQVYECIWGL